MGPQLLTATEPADRDLYLGIAEAAMELRAKEIQALARAIRNEVADMLG